ncbi:DNA-binding transcriptional regulator, MarR family [Pasteurella testudinis DSM 23072]|uniref:DNA-binding transcriptional regulator, MarR family n=1 Tax=Pasteurella testudinis DSM 23072 TaxID=1122938 RepID=A0A1W1UH95_9PAST|nr:MarR family transcriptional regulator [Pasteurella testudinis]SMB80402.1 DNA-binding transcriptional regulator, MarR family [Pasteurella testudinis DSM 23072]SUB51882.1 Benzoate anaerobic degradation regulator [Pasteurella testudinis]
MNSANQCQSLIWQLKNLTLNINKSLDQLLQQEGLTLSQARVLLLLFNENGQSQSNLMKQLQIESSSMTKVIDLLERKNFIVRKDNHRDARRKHIFLTKQGQHKEAAITQLLQQFENELLNGLSVAETAQLRRLLQKMQPDNN